MYVQMLRAGGPNVDEAMWHARGRYDDLSRCCFCCLVGESEYYSSFLNHEYLGIWMTMNPSARAGWLSSPEEGYRDVAKFFAFESKGICAVWQFFSFDKAYRRRSLSHRERVSVHPSAWMYVDVTGPPRTGVYELVGYAGRRYHDLPGIRLYGLSAHCEGDDSFFDHEYLGVAMLVQPWSRTGRRVRPEKRHRNAEILAFKLVGSLGVRERIPEVAPMDYL
jgi:hypothetical protein